MIKYTPYRIEDDETTTAVSQHDSIVEGVAAGQHVVSTLDHDFSYGLYADDVKVASFADGRIGYREWARRAGRLLPQPRSADEYIHSIDDRYDHDMDELGLTF
jgi:hypothetical protein